MWLLTAFALAAPCPAPLKLPDFLERLDQARNEGELRSLLACLSAPLDPAAAQRVYSRMESLHPSAATSSSGLLALGPSEGWVQVDGHYRQKLDSSHPAVLQWFGEQGEVLATRYWRPGDPLGELAGISPNPGWRLRLEVAAGTLASQPGPVGGSFRLGLGVEGATRWGLTARTGYQGMVGTQVATLQSGWALIGLHADLGRIGLGMGPTWTAAWGRWTVQGQLQQGISFGPGGRLEVEAEPGGPWIFTLGGGFWTDGSRWFGDATLGLALRLGA